VGCLGLRTSDMKSNVVYFSQNLVAAVPSLPATTQQRNGLESLCLPIPVTCHCEKANTLFLSLCNGEYAETFNVSSYFRIFHKLIRSCYY
jgi:hypothetical protein